MKLALALLVASLCLIGVGVRSEAQTPAPRPTAEEFRRLHAQVLGGSENVIPGNLAQLAGWSSGKDIKSLRRSFAERGTSDAVIRKRYAVDIPSVQGRERLLLVAQVPEPPESDTTISWLFNDTGNIVRVFELFANRNWDVEERFGGVHDNRGFQVWRLTLAAIARK